MAGGSRKALFRAVALLGSVAAACLLLEGGLRLVGRLGAGYDFEMWRYASDLKAETGNPALPFRHAPGKRGIYYGVEIRTDSAGYREDSDPGPRRAGVPRIAILGDSFALGWGVAGEAAAGKALERLARAAGRECETFNLGVGNYNTAMEFELFKSEWKRLKPDAAVLLYYVNDAEPTPRLSVAGTRAMKRSWLLAFLGMKLRQIAVRSAGEDPLAAYYSKLYGGGAEGARRSREALHELSALCASNGIRLLIVNIPDLRRIENYPFGFATRHVREAAVADGVPFLDLLPEFAPHGGSALWVSKEDPHMNARAHAIAAGAIFRALRAEGVL